METVYDPYVQGEAQYMPQQQPYNPQAQPQPTPQQQQMPPVQQQQQWPPQPQPMPQQQPVQQQQQQWPQQPVQQQQQQPVQQQQQQQQPVQQQWPQQGQQPNPASQVVKLPCTKKQMERKNLLIMDGYMNNIKLTNAPDGSITRIGFLLAWEASVWENGQQVYNPDGTAAVRDVRFAMQAWGQVAQALSNLPVGTPLRVYASANRWNAARQGAQGNWQTDFRVNSFEQL